MFQLLIVASVAGIDFPVMSELATDHDVKTLLRYFENYQSAGFRDALFDSLKVKETEAKKQGKAHVGAKAMLEAWDTASFLIADISKTRCGTSRA